ncbi:uncharacterized protein LOC141697677 [Apium graveolens]|uniref:uncharacterized protein LOC141697677 n=1 Tax=Apium graveolens TaxID=4045 RepID=UPI003D7A2273
MAALNQIQGGMYGISLKPRLLRYLIKHKLPDEKHPFRDTSELVHLSDTVRTHRLLSETSSQPIDQNVMEEWKSAVDSWINLLVQLVSVDLPDKCWVGICLLGLTCEECSSERFLASYSVWFNKLLSHIQSQGESPFLMVASCASLSDLLTRLSGFSNLKKDGTSHALKVIQPVLKLLNEDISDSTKDGAISLLYTVITSFPASVHRHYESVEAAIVAKIMSGKCSVGLLKKLGYCLALLPKSKGDEDSWLLMMRKILILMNVQLKDAFQGLEEESKSDEALRVLIPPGNDPPPPLGGLTMPITSYGSTKRPELLLMCSVSTLIDCCSTMLTCPYLIQVSVPIQSLVMLIRRVLMLDGSVSQNLYSLMTTMQQELICSELPVLHLRSLELLTAIVKGVRSQLLPHVAEITLLVTEYFKKCALPELRIMVYSIIRILLRSMGVGMSLYLTQEVINNTFVDLDYISFTSGDLHLNLNSNASFEPPQQPVQKKRKHASATVSVNEQTDRIGTEIAVPKIITPISVKIAALHTLETLLTVGGAIRSDSWRPDVDRLLVAIALDACKGGWAKQEKNIFLSAGRTDPWAEFQMAALKALLASLISPNRVRPPFLSQGLELFRKGAQETGTELSEFCSHALMALEVLIHPRALSLIDSASDTNVIGSKRRIPGSMYSSDQKGNTSYSGGTLGNGNDDPESDDDDLYNSWLGTDGDIADTLTENNTTTVAPFASKDPSAENQFSLDKAFGAEVPQISGRREFPGDVSKGIQEATAIVGEIGERVDDEIMIERQGFRDTIQYSAEAFAVEGQTYNNAPVGSMSVQPDTVKIVENSTTSALKNRSTQEEDVPLTILSNFVGSSGLLLEHNADSSDESIPDIVDEESDSD